MDAIGVYWRLIIFVITGMSRVIFENILQKIAYAPELYHRLILVVGPAGAGKTKALQELHQETDAPLINVNLELSQKMLEMTERQQILRLPRLLDELLASTSGEVVLLDNIELLFHPRFQQDPLRLLQKLARNRTLVVAWNGVIRQGHLIYAEPDHPEYRTYPARDLQIVQLASQ